MKMKKLFAMGLSVAMVAASMAACGGDSTGSSNAAADSNAPTDSSAAAGSEAAGDADASVDTGLSLIHILVCATETQELSRKVIRPDEYPHKKGTKNNFEHGEYELCWWPKFLPGLYNVWKDHPDPTQNVYYDLSVEKTGDYKWKYIEDNSLPVLERPQYKMNK